MTTQAVAVGREVDAGRAILLARAEAYARATLSAPPGPPASFLTEDEIAAAAGRVAIPRAVLSLADAFLGYVAPHRRAVFPRRWIAACAPGDVAVGVTSALLVWLLADPAYGLAVDVGDAEVARAIDRVASVHRRLAAGDAPTRADWTAARRAFADPPDRFDSIAGQCAQAAAWPPATSASVGPQALQRWVICCDAMVDRHQGWTMADYDRLQDVQAAIWARTAADRAAGLTPDLDALMIAADADLAARWTCNTDARRIVIADRMAAAMDQFVALLSATPPPR